MVVVVVVVMVTAKSARASCPIVCRVCAMWRVRKALSGAASPPAKARHRELACRHGKLLMLRGLGFRIEGGG